MLAQETKTMQWASLVIHFMDQIFIQTISIFTSSNMLLFALSSLNICWGLVSSIQAPFFPMEAIAKGASASQFGPVFGIIHAALFFTSPVLGRWIRVIGVGRVFKFGLVLPSICCVLFGLLTFIPSTTGFLLLAYSLRLLEGVGGAALWTAMLTLLLARYPESSSRVYALVDATFGLGFMSGPVLGSFLFNAGGFLLPFLVCGVCMVITGVISVFSIKKVVALAEDMEENNELSFRKLLSIPGVMAGLLSATISAFSIGYIESLLEPHLSQFHLSVPMVGLSFLAMSGTYTLTTLLLGWLADRYLSPWLVCTCGLTTILLAFILLGPSPYLTLEPSLPLTVVALMLQGAGSAAAIVTSYSTALSSALAKGYRETVDTYSIVSGVWTSAFALGNFMGPTAAGFLFDQIGFSWGTVVVQVVVILGIALNIFVRMWSNETRRNRGGYEAL